MESQRLKKDKYRKARGGWARMLEVSCAKCGHAIMKYQKDGAGPLKRLYFDRITAPDSLVEAQHIPLKRVSKLTCPRCKTLVGIPYRYDKEPRNAFRLVPGSFVKEIAKSK